MIDRWKGALLYGAEKADWSQNFENCSYYYTYEYFFMMIGVIIYIPFDRSWLQRLIDILTSVSLFRPTSKKCCFFTWNLCFGEVAFVSFHNTYTLTNAQSLSRFSLFWDSFSLRWQNENLLVNKCKKTYLNIHFIVLYCNNQVKVKTGNFLTWFKIICN